MYTSTDFYLIDQLYFNIIQLSLLTITIQSKNTGHYWHIEHLRYPKFQSYVIYHRHHDIAPYHKQTNAPTLLDALTIIRNHDTYHLQRKTKSTGNLS